MKAIIFDFGNVLGFFDHGLTLARLAKHTDLKPIEIFDAIYNGDLEEALESGRLSVPDFLRLFRERCRLTCDDHFIQGAVADIFTPNEELTTLVPQLAKRYRLVLGSNTNPIHAAHFQKQFTETLRHFHSLVLSHEVGTRKPKAAFFLECVRRAECAPGECLFIDDLPGNVAGAAACGLRGLVYRPGLDVLRHLADT